MSSLAQSLFSFPGLVSVKYAAQRLKMVLVSAQQGGSWCPEANYKMPNPTVSVSSSAWWDTVPNPPAVTLGDAAAVGFCFPTRAHKEHQLGQGTGWEM